MERKCSVALKNGSLLTSRRYGVHLTSDDGGTLLVQESAIEEYIHFYHTKRHQKRLRCMTPMEFHAAA